MKQILRMNKKIVYFDHAATTPLHPKVLEKMLPYLKEYYGNPSSIHEHGRKVRVAIEEAREVIASSINARPSEIYFVSGGTEANNFSIFGIAKNEFNERGKKSIITSKAEHQCVLEAVEELKKQSYNTKFVPVNEACQVSPDSLKNILDEDTSLVSIMHVNNETGAVNEIKNLAEITHENSSYFHTDAVQSFGKLEIDVQKIPVDSLSISGHKINGPKGVGAVYVKTGVPVSPIIFGGSQERNRRGGTENPAAIIGFAEAAKISLKEMKNNFTAVYELKKRFIEGLKAIDGKGLKINCAETNFPYILSVTLDNNFYKADAEAMLIYLDINGIAASNGAACTSGTLKPSHVIMSMGKSKEYAEGTLRFSFSAENTLEEVEYVLEVVEKMARKFKRK